MHGADSRAGKHGDDQFRDHGQIDGYDITFLYSKGFEDIGKFVHLPVHVEVRVNLPVIGVVALEDDGGLCFLCFQVPVQAIVADVELSTLEP